MLEEHSPQSNIQLLWSIQLTYTSIHQTHLLRALGECSRELPHELPEHWLLALLDEDLVARVEARIQASTLLLDAQEGGQQLGCGGGLVW